MAHVPRNRSGCYRCKQRRVKCDQQKPKCSACRTHQWDCLWPGEGQKSDIWPSQDVSKELYIKMSLQDRYGDTTMALVRGSITDCPAYSISPGYTQLNSDEEHKLLVSLASFLRLQTALTAYKDHLSDVGFEFTVALQRPWVRNALFALSALIAAARGLGPRQKVLEYRGVAVRNIGQRMTSTQGQRDQEELLVAALFLGLMDTNILVGQMHPSGYYITVGYLLNELGVMSSDLLSQDLRDVSPALRFRRISYESYLHQMAGSAFRQPQSYKSIRLSHPSTYPIGGLPSSVDTNTLVPLDLNCFYILYEISRLHHSPTYPNAMVKLQNLRHILQTLTCRYENDPPPVAPEAFLHQQFKILTSIALGALRIFCAKAIDNTLTTTSPEIREARQYSLHYLQFWFVKNLWPGYLTWIFVILLCAAEKEEDVQTICAKIDESLASVFSANLLHLKGVTEKLNRLQGPPRRPSEPQEGQAAPTQEVQDSLALMFGPI